MAFRVTNLAHEFSPQSADYENNDCIRNQNMLYSFRYQINSLSRLFYSLTIFVGGSRYLSFFCSGMPCLKSHKLRAGSAVLRGIGGIFSKCFPKSALESGSAHLCRKENMGEPNNVLREYMKKPDRVRSVLEYYFREKTPENWEIEAVDGFYSVRNSTGKASFRERDGIRRIHAGGSVFLLGLENQATGEEETNTCKAVRDIERYAEQKGKKEGIKQGRREGKKEGIEQGRKEGMELGAFEMLCSLVRDGLLQLSEAAGKINLSEVDFKEKMRMSK